MACTGDGDTLGGGGNRFGSVGSGGGGRDTDRDATQPTLGPHNKHRGFEHVHDRHQSAHALAKYPSRLGGGRALAGSNMSMAGYVCATLCGDVIGARGGAIRGDVMGGA